MTAGGAFIKKEPCGDITLDKGNPYSYYVICNNVKSETFTFGGTADESREVKFNFGQFIIKTNVPKKYGPTIQMSHFGAEHKEFSYDPSSRIPTKGLGMYSIIAITTQYGWKPKNINTTFTLSEGDKYEQTFRLKRQFSKTFMFGFTYTQKMNLGLTFSELFGRVGWIMNLHTNLYTTQNFGDTPDKKTSLLSERQYRASDNEGCHAYTGTLGVIVRIIRPISVYCSGGFGSYSNVYKYEGNLYTPGTSKGPAIEGGVVLYPFKPIALSAGIIKILGDKEFTDACVGLHFFFPKYKAKY